MVITTCSVGPVTDRIPEVKSTIVGLVADLALPANGLTGLTSKILQKCLSDHMFSHSGHYPCEYT